MNSQEKTMRNAKTLADYGLQGLELSEEQTESLLDLLAKTEAPETEEAYRDRDLIVKALHSGITIQQVLNNPHIGRRKGEFPYRGFIFTWITNIHNGSETTTVRIAEEDDPQNILHVEEVTTDVLRGGPLPPSAERALDMARCWVMTRIMEF